jgi:hypothetical protein
MLLVIITVALFLSVPLAGGRLMALADLELRGSWAALTAISLQILIVSVFPDGDQDLYEVIHMFTYALAGWFLFANRRLPGVVLIAAGASLNVLAITANGGVMPAAHYAIKIAGIDKGDDFANSAPVSDPNLLFLGDIIPIPGPWPIGNVLSVGDLVLFTGAALLLHGVCRRSPAPAPQAA